MILCFHLLGSRSTTLSKVKIHNVSKLFFFFGGEGGGGGGTARLLQGGLDCSIFHGAL